MKKTIEQYENELRNSIIEFFNDYPDYTLEISSHDGGSVELLNTDIEFEELDINISVDDI